MDARELKIQAAGAALEHVRHGMRLGIGTGSTADEFVRLLAEKVEAGLSVQGVPTSERTAGQCLELGVPLYCRRIQGRGYARALSIADRGLFIWSCSHADHCGKDIRSTGSDRFNRDQDGPIGAFRN